jgi:hypothetical protein
VEVEELLAAWSPQRVQPPILPAVRWRLRLALAGRNSELPVAL